MHSVYKIAYIYQRLLGFLFFWEWLKLSPGQPESSHDVCPTWSHACKNQSIALTFPAIRARNVNMSWRQYFRTSFLPALGECLFRYEVRRVISTSHSGASSVLLGLVMTRPTECVTSTWMGRGWASLRELGLRRVKLPLPSQPEDKHWTGTLPNTITGVLVISTWASDGAHRNRTTVQRTWLRN